jgi:hypothetical protein
MGNLVIYAHRPDLPALQMSNGLTSVFVAVLSLAAAELAEDDQQREIAAWIASRDQGVYGLGIVGFDVGDLPWRPETFALDRAFVLRVIEAALAQRGWERLGYQPREDWIRESLEGFRTLVEAFDVTHACWESWGFGDRPERLVLCPKHGVYLHLEGCVLCNDL